MEERAITLFYTAAPGCKWLLQSWLAFGRWPGLEQGRYEVFDGGRRLPIILNFRVKAT
jgi:hypothetical protein